jgi:hypothetical protein
VTGGVGSELIHVANGPLKLMPKGTDAGDKARNPWCLFKGKDFISPSLELIHVANGALKLMPKGTDAGDRGGRIGTDSCR